MPRTTACDICERVWLKRQLADAGVAGDSLIIKLSPAKFDRTARHYGRGRRRRLRSSECGLVRLEDPREKRCASVEQKAEGFSGGEALEVVSRGVNSPTLVMMKV